MKGRPKRAVTVSILMLFHFNPVVFHLRHFPQGRDTRQTAREIARARIQDLSVGIHAIRKAHSRRVTALEAFHFICELRDGRINNANHSILVSFSFQREHLQF